MENTARRDTRRCEFFFFFFFKTRENTRDRFKDVNRARLRDKRYPYIRKLTNTRKRKYQVQSGSSSSSSSVYLHICVNEGENLRVHQ